MFYEIFILEDAQFDAEFIEVVLKEAGITDYHFFSNPDVFLARLNPKVHIVLMDYKLDHSMNGLDVIKKVKQRNPYCYFVMLSGMLDYEIAFQLNSIALRSKFMRKDTPDLQQRLASVIKDFLEDIIMINDTYAKLNGDMRDFNETIEKALK